LVTDRPAKFTKVCSSTKKVVFGIRLARKLVLAAPVSGTPKLKFTLPLGRGRTGTVHDGLIRSASGIINQ
jgi:hypothetical protein